MHEGTTARRRPVAARRRPEVVGRGSAVLSLCLVALAGVASGCASSQAKTLVELPPLDMPIPADANHVHFGKGQTETTIELKPGKHTLQLLLGDQLHVPHDPALVSKKITITVK